jgi:hypothetical protein
MNPKRIEYFFRVLDHELDYSAELIVVGAGAGSLMGYVRPSVDLDFEIRPRGTLSAPLKARIAEAIETTTQKTRIACNYTENVSGWSMIKFLDYRKKAIRYKTIGKLRIKLMAPAYWTLGKMARFLELDAIDVQKIVKKKKMAPGPLIRLWAKALRKSPLSLKTGQFKKHVEIFLQTRARRTWGKQVKPAALIAFFHKELRRP